MASIRLNKVIKELNIGLSTAVEKLADKGHDIDNKPTSKITDEQYQILLEAFAEDRVRKEKAEQVNRLVREEKESHRTSKESSRAKEEEVAAPAAEKAPEPEPAPVKEEAKPTPPVEPKTEDPAPVKAEEAKEEPKAKAEEKPAAEEKPKVEVKTEEPKKAEEAPKKEAPKAEVKEEAPAEEEKVEAPKSAEKEEDSPRTRAAKLSGPKVLSKIELEPKKPAKKAEAKKAEPAKPAAKPAAEKPKETEKPVAEKPAEPKAAEKVEPTKEEIVDQNHKTKYIKLEGPKFTGQKIELPAEKPKKKPVDKKAAAADNKRKRKRIKKVPDKPNAGPGSARPGAPQRKGAPRKKVEKVELTDEQIQKQIKETLEKLTTRKKSKGSKFRRDKRQERREQEELQDMQREEQSKVLKVTEFVTVTELANMMSASVNDVISTLMGLGVMVTMNQRLDAEVLSLVAEEFGYSAEFVDSEVTESFTIEEDDDKDLSTRAPIVTVMGHVDHGKTSLLDYIRSTNVIAGEAGGITQHIGAYAVTLESGQHLTFLDTPGHEAFTAMRARGAQVTDVAIIVVAADDAVMPQTKEAIAHAQAANVPFVIALNKSDRPAANPDKIKEQLSAMNVLVEDWGGTIQCQQVSAKTGDGIPELLEKVLLESEMLDLKANPNRNALGTVIEASLDKGRGYVTTILVENGTLKMGDYVLAGPYSGKVKAMLDERGHRMKEAGPATPVSLLGLDGAPQAGDRFMVMDDEREAKQLAAKRTQLQREQSVRSQKKMTLEEIGRRLAIGDFQELNIVLKGDVDGSIEALADSLQKLSTPEIAVKIIHKGVGQISESDVLLASASDAILIGFQVRPSASARKIADREEVDIRLYSIIYDAINQIKDAMEGMLSPDVKEEITGTAEIRETFKISKVGTIAGCMVTDGTIYRNAQMRLIRDGVVIYTGDLGSLKRFKDDVKEVKKGYECGLNVKNYNDIKVGDVVESFKEVEVKKTLD